MLTYTVRPLSDRTHFTGDHRPSQFTATWTDTLDVLERELRHLDATDVVIEVDVPERGIRNDGRLRSDAKAASPGVRVAFDSKHGPQIHACDTYIRPAYLRSRMDDWQHNVRAIALKLEALRAVDRYGGSSSGEQYRGYRAIETQPMPGAMTIDQALAVISGHSQTHVSYLRHLDELRRAVRRAQRSTHPDTGGRPEDFDQVQAAVDVLRREGRLT